VTDGVCPWRSFIHNVQFKHHRIRTERSNGDDINFMIDVHSAWHAYRQDGQRSEERRSLSLTLFGRFEEERLPFLVQRRTRQDDPSALKATGQSSRAV